MINVVIVGAHEGADIERYLSAHVLTKANTDIYAFEPDPNAFRCLRKKREIHERLIPLPFAVGLGDNQEALFHYPNGMSTTASPYFRTEQPSGFAMVWTMRLDSFMMLYELKELDYLIIDVPFCEEECLESLSYSYKVVRRGSIRVYADIHIITGWLDDHGFSIDVKDDVIYFWRSTWDIR